MRALVQRVSEASVTVESEVVGSIAAGLCVFLGVKQDDTEREAEQLAGKVCKLRIFPDESARMNCSLQDVRGELLVISQFTLYGSTSSGNRPSYSRAARPEVAEQLYESFTIHCRSLCCRVETGVFRANMQVRLINDGPVTLMCAAGE